ncbi:MAG: hypothetical protein M0R37_12075 [Bacteroidales bacterium]|jgi:hypothetical protein|nr:hypothetical protein [Sphaerochaeta sp.]MCK9629312.1 hypothetical protein [Bacteroidales bacterium]
MNDLKLAERLVVELLGIFPRSFCAYGTALGVVREGAILAHDLDTDIGVMSADFSWDSVVEAVRRGWEIRHVFGMRHLGLEIALMRDGVKTDVMVIYPEAGGFTNSLWDNGGRNGLADRIIHSYPSPVMGVEEWRMGDVPVRTLGPAYLAHVYGDWRTPVKSWDWRTDHLCRKAKNA